LNAYDPSIEFIEPRLGDQYSFCTDGITEELSDTTLDEFVQTAENFEQRAQNLIGKVLDGPAQIMQLL
jgi:serine/threonine protein phosphatase PrpC